MNLTISQDIVREAALICMLEEPSEWEERIRNELWCLRNDIDMTEFSDITMCKVPTSLLIDYVLKYGPRDTHDQAALLLCTMGELS